jgi:hypothetical protein
MEDQVNTNNMKRVIAGVGAASLLATVMAVPVTAAPPGGTSRNITVTGTTDIFAPTGDVAMSAGELVSFSVTVRNGGPQTVNNISLVFGLDDNPAPQANGDATPPSQFPTGISVAEDSTKCTGGQIVNCTIGTLGAKKEFTTSITMTTTPDAPPSAPSSTTLVEAVASVAEAGGDSGYNIDTFSDQGDIVIVAYSCDATTAYRLGNASKTITTCPIGTTGNANGQSTVIQIPSRLWAATIREVVSDDCPAAADNSGCIGDEVVADITGETTDDVIFWEMQIDTNGASINLQKLYFVHNGVTPISLAKKNACKSLSSVNCGSASLSGTILTVTVQTPGNGSGRVRL